MSAPVLWQPQLGSALTRDNSQTPLFPVDETPASWPNGSDASPTEGHYSTPRTMGPGISPTPSNYTPPLTSPTTPLPRAFPDGSSTPSPVHQRPSTPSARPPMPPSIGGSMLSSS